MNQKERMQAWEQDVAAWRETQDLAYEVAKAHSKLFEGVVAKLSEAGVDLQPLFEQLQIDLEKLTNQPRKEK